MRIIRVTLGTRSVCIMCIVLYIDSIGNKLCRVTKSTCFLSSRQMIVPSIFVVRNNYFDAYTCVIHIEIPMEMHCAPRFIFRLYSCLNRNNYNNRRAEANHCRSVRTILYMYDEKVRWFNQSIVFRSIETQQLTY